MANLFYVIGASGAGKDSLIDYIRSNLPGDAPVVIAHRYITRPADAGGENHVALSRQEFLLRQQQACFAMHWYSHDTCYGIGTEINLWLNHDLNVVVNGSRAYLNEAAQRYPNLVPVLISVDPEVLRDRLRARGREDEQQINKRLQQAIQLEKQVRHPDLIRLENNTRLQDAGQSLLNIILHLNREKCA